MKTEKIAIGILSIVLFIIISLQSCAAGIGNAVTLNGESGGTAGFILAVCMIVAGIVGITTSNQGNAGAITAGVIYIAGAIAGVLNMGHYTDLGI